MRNGQHGFPRHLPGKNSGPVLTASLGSGVSSGFLSSHPISLLNLQLGLWLRSGSLEAEPGLEELGTHESSQEVWSKRKDVRAGLSRGQS